MSASLLFTRVNLNFGEKKLHFELLCRVVKRKKSTVKRIQARLAVLSPPLTSADPLWIFGFCIIPGGILDQLSYGHTLLVALTLMVQKCKGPLGCKRPAHVININSLLFPSPPPTTHYLSLSLTSNACIRPCPGMS